MAGFESLIGTVSIKQNLGTGVLLAVGIAIAGYGGYMHLTIAAQVRTGQCDACAPWHPLFVLAPLIVGVMAVLMAAYLRLQR